MDQIRGATFYLNSLALTKKLFIDHLVNNKNNPQYIKSFKMEPLTVMISRLLKFN